MKPKGALSPADKTERVEHERRAWGTVAMVGDGLNDAGALGAADVGIAFGRAADLSREHADVSVLREDLGEVAELLRVARHTLATVRGNLLWAFGYNLAGVEPCGGREALADRGRGRNGAVEPVRGVEFDAIRSDGRLHAFRHDVEQRERLMIDQPHQAIEHRQARGGADRLEQREAQERREQPVTLTLRPSRRRRPS